MTRQLYFSLAGTAVWGAKIFEFIFNRIFWSALLKEKGKVFIFGQCCLFKDAYQDDRATSSFEEFSLLVTSVCTNLNDNFFFPFSQKIIFAILEPAVRKPFTSMKRKSVLLHVYCSFSVSSCCCIDIPRLLFRHKRLASQMHVPVNLLWISQFWWTRHRDCQFWHEYANNESTLENQQKMRL